MRDIYARHKAACKNAIRPNARQKFGCGCPIYGRITIQDPVTRDILFDHNGSLTKFGATSLETAEALVDSWTLKYLSGEKPPAHRQESSLTVKEAVSKYLAYKATRYNVRWTPPEDRLLWTSDQKKQDREQRAGLTHKQQASIETLRKLEDALCGLPTFCEQRKVQLLADIDDALLVSYQETWHGKRVMNTATGKWTHAPKSPHSKQKYQRDLQALFTHWHDRGKISVNVGRLLDPISLPPSEIHVYTPEQVRAVFTAIAEVFRRFPTWSRHSFLPRCIPPSECPIWSHSNATPFLSPTKPVAQQRFNGRPITGCTLSYRAGSRQSYTASSDIASILLLERDGNRRD